jgi:hypothetical protein
MRKEKKPELRDKHSVGSAPTRKDDKFQGVATIRSGPAEEPRSWRLQRGYGSFMGEPAPKR